MIEAIKAGLTAALIAGALAAALDARAAIYCTGDAECLSKGISLVKRAAQNGCDARELAGVLRAVPTSHEQIDSGIVQRIEVCIEKAKYAKSREKKAAKRIERIEKALSTPVK